MSNVADGYDVDDTDFGEDVKIVKELFSDSQAQDGPAAVLERVRSQYGFDLIAFVKTTIKDDPLAMPRTVNYIRARVRLGLAPADVIKEVTSNTGGWQSNNEYLLPVIPDDPLLWYGDDFSEAGDGELASEEEDDDDDDDGEAEDDDDFISEEEDDSEE